jgi:predicted permease
MTDAGAATRQMARVTPGLFDLLGGIRPVRGRLFDATEGRSGTDDPVLLSEDLWRGFYHADPSLIGRSITIDNKPVTVIGVLPSDFRFPAWNTEVWKADTFEAQPDERPTVYVRFAPGVPREDALRAATRAAQTISTNYRNRWAQARSLETNELDDYYQRAIPLLSGGVVLLVLVLCANVSSLLLTGLTARGREFAIRAALGASRLRLVRLALLESGLCGAVGIAVGVGIAWALVSVSRAVLPQAALLHSLNPLNIDTRALVVTSVAGLAATLVAGVLPAIIGTGVDTGRSLQSTGRTSTETASARFTRGGLLACQIALSCMLLFGATLLVRSFMNLVKQDRGLDTSNILVARIEFPSKSFTTPESRVAVSNRLADEVRAIPGVSLTSWSYGNPPGGAVTYSGEWRSDQPGAEPVNITADMFLVTSDFFALHRIPLIRGHAFQPSDEPNAVLVSERFAKALWPGLDPIGRTFSFTQGQRTVIGVVKDIHYPALDRTLDKPQWYAQFRGVLNLGMLSLRCDGKCPDSAVVTQRLAAANTGAKIDAVRPLDTFYFKELARPRASAALAFAFASTALIAVAAGLFSLLTHSVARLRRELGIRMALGATPSDVRRLVWRQGLAVTLTGFGIGILAGLALGRMLASLLFGVRMTDPLSWGIVVSVMGLTIAAASWHPTRSAVGTAPVVLLREE